MEVHWTASFGQGKCIELKLIAQLSLYPQKSIGSIAICIPASVFARLKQVQMIKVPDRRGLGNQGCTV